MVTPADPSSPGLSSILGRRGTTTPTASVRKDRDDNQKRFASERPPVDTVAPEPAVNTTKVCESMCPCLVFASCLMKHDRPYSVYTE